MAFARKLGCIAVVKSWSHIVTRIALLRILQLLLVLLLFDGEISTNNCLFLVFCSYNSLEPCCLSKDYYNRVAFTIHYLHININYVKLSVR